MDDNELQEAKEAFMRWAENNPHANMPLMAFLAGWQINAEVVLEGEPGIVLEPKDRLTRLAEVAASAIRSDPAGGHTIKLIIMLQDGAEGGIEISGYRKPREALVDLLLHMKELLKAHGIDPNTVFQSVGPPLPGAFGRKGVAGEAAYRIGERKRSL